MQDHIKIYDLDFKEIELPKDNLGYGFLGLGLDVSSVGKEVTEHTGARLPGSIITGVRDTDRTMILKARIKAMNATDYVLKRDRTYEFFSSLGSFYVTESLQGNKLMKVMVADQYTPERPVGIQTYAFLDIPLKIDGQPYWISRKTTMDLHNNKGIPADGGWSFGMGIDVSPDELKYQYENASSFNIYNAGKELKLIQEKDNFEIKVEINQEVTSFTLQDAAGGKWEYNSSKKNEWKLKKGDVIIFNGHDVRLNKTTIMDRSNRYYFVIDNGNNLFKVNGLSEFKITFNFRFKYY